MNVLEDASHGVGFAPGEDGVKRPEPENIDNGQALAWEELLLRALALQRVRALSPAWRYGLALAAVAPSARLRWALIQWLGTMAPYNVWVMMAATVTALLGLGPGLLFVVSGMIGVEVFLLRSLSAAETLPRMGFTLFIGIFVCILIHLMRVAARKACRSEAAVRASEAQLAHAQQIADVGSWEWNISTGELAWSAQIYRQLGEEPGRSTPTQRGFTQRVHPEDRSRFQEAIERALAGTSPYDVEFRIVRPDGAVRVMQSHGEVERGPGGEPLRMAGVCTDITERKQAEDALLETEERFRAFVRASSDVAYRMSADWKQLLFLKGREFLADTVEPSSTWMHRYIHPEDQAQVLAVIDEAIRTKSAFELEHRVLRVDGTLGWTFSRAVPLLDAKGEIAEWFGVARDITRRKEAEAAVRADLAALTRMHALSEKVLGARGLKPLLQEVMEAAVSIVGAERGTLQLLEGDSLRIVAHHGHDAPFLKFFESAESRASVCGEATRRGERVMIPDVEQSPLFAGTPSLAVLRAAGVRAVQSTPMLGRSGKLLGILTTQWSKPHRPDEHDLWRTDLLVRQASDVIEQSRAEAALRESEERFRRMADGTPLIIWVSDANADNRYVNRAYREFFGVTAEEVERQGWQPLVHPEDRAAYPEAVLIAIRERKSMRSEVRVKRHDGAWRWMETYAEPRFSATGEFLGVAESSLDITERKEFQAELQRLVDKRTAELQELVGELEHFSYTITHDLKSPLRAMRGFAEMMTLMTRRQRERGKAREFLGRIASAAERMDRLIADALNYSRTMREELPLEDVDAGALLRGMLDSYPELQPEKARIRVEGPLPVVLANEAGLTQCFSNLLGNAVKFVKPGEMPDVRVWAGPHQARVRIWVEDKGIGIAKEMLPRVFDMFSRGSRSYEGTGIGLALVRKVIQRMGGQVGVESEEGQGSRFWIELRRGQVKESSRVPVACTEVAAGEGTVLYVEDEESEAMFMEQAFKGKGLESKLRLVGDGRAAIQYLSGAGDYADREKYPAPALVVLDLNLPHVPGFGVLEWMRQNPDYAQTPVVVFSSSTREDDRVRAKELGANEFAAKPSSGLKFAEVVEGLRERWRL